MHNWFECKVTYEKMMENGLQKVSEPYLVDALSFTEAEARKEQERANRRAVGGSQSNQAEQLVAQVLGSLDKKVAAEIRPIVMRSDNKLAVLQQELSKRGIRI